MGVLLEDGGQTDVRVDEVGHDAGRSGCGGDSHGRGPHFDAAAMLEATVWRESVLPASPAS
ncbi:MAG: hypothetical protein ACYDD1_14045, partial [Caulobacteraceae bacterium]